MILYHGTTREIPFLKDNSWVSKSPEEAWTYATVLAKSISKDSTPMLYEVTVDKWDPLVRLGGKTINGTVRDDVCTIRRLSSDEVETLLKGTLAARFETAEVVDLMPLVKNKI